MKLRYIKPFYLDELNRIDVEVLREKIKTSSNILEDLFSGEDWYAESRIDWSGNVDFITEGEPSSRDADNAIRLHKELGDKITHTQATDPRLWVYLSHVKFVEYMKWRWPIELCNFKDRYLVNGRDSRALSRNGIARLWWFAHLTYDQNRVDHYELTKIFLQNQNIQHNLLERSFGRNKNVLHSVLDFIQAYPHLFKNNKGNLETLGKAINRKGGAILLDYCTKEQIASYLSETFSV